LDILAFSLLPDLGFVLNVLTVAVGLGLVIFVHELGHFAVAKWCDVNVERFSIGFGPILFSRKWGETEYALSAIPFGGYVKMLGQDDIDPSQLTSEEIARDPRSYTAKSVGQRMAIISAGVTMNIITGLMFFAAAFSWGIQRPDSEVGSVHIGMPAWEQGVRPGDRLLEINGNRIYDFTDVVRNVALSSGPIALKGIRPDGTKYSVTIEPKKPKDGKPVRQIGVGPASSLTVAGLSRKEEDRSAALVPGLPASESQPGFERDDQVRRVGSQEVRQYSDLETLLMERRGEPLDLHVHRKGQGDELVKITVGPQPYRTLGLQMDIGKIVAVRPGSPAARSGLLVGDKIIRVAGKEIGDALDPQRLPEEFADRRGEPVEVEISREVQGSEPVTKLVTITPEQSPPWRELPQFPHAPLSITSIGAAYHLIPTVYSYDANGPARKAGIGKKDSVVSVEFILREDAPEEIYEDVSRVVKIGDDNWAFAFWQLQTLPVARVKLKVKSPESAEKEVELTPIAATDWYVPDDRGLFFKSKSVTLQGEGVGDSLAMGWRHTRNGVSDIYLTLRGLTTGDVSPTSFHGPIGIAKFAYESAGSSFAEFVLFLGIISVNLAVINFLPIPVLDGGHMVFLGWEAVVRRKPSEKVVMAATYCGFALVVSLMIFVIYLDLVVH
jgi:regulator of sigma E protease